MIRPSLQQSEQLVPIRIDVMSEDNNVRIVDTLLIDRTVWPVPLRTQDGPAALKSSLSTNAWYYAESVLGDAEVLGMGRTARHFTGRLDLWTPNMLEKIQACILPQLVAAVSHSDTAKRGLSDSQPETQAAKKMKTGSEPPTVGSSTSMDTNPDKSEENAKPNTAYSTPITSSSTQETSTALYANLVKSSTIPICTRLSIHGIRIHDDWMWDPSLRDLNSLVMVESVGKDLNLPPEAIQAMAVSMTEQLWGLNLPPDPEQFEVDEGGPQDRRNTTAAWALEQRVQLTNVAHLVNQYRPAGSSFS
jgi:hypothetical protein